MSRKKRPGELPRWILAANFWYTGVEASANFYLLSGKATVYGGGLTIYSVEKERLHRPMLSLRSSTILALLAALTLSGCGVLVGNVRPEDSKSHSYGVADLSKESPDWIKLDPQSVGGVAPGQDPDTTSTEVSDVAFQSKGTASIISLNSACQAGKAYKDKDLRTLTNVLLLGASDVMLRDEKNLTVENTPALQTTLLGKINGEQVMLRTVVLKRQTCVYDLVYVSRPANFTLHEKDFARFVESLRLK